VKRPSKFSGNDGDQGLHAVPDHPAVPPAASGETIIPFPRSAAAALAAEGSEDAGVSSASASSFVPLSVPIRAVVMRLQGKFPKIRVERATEGDFAARSDDRSAAWEEEDQR
jgi:hypothetical protein